MTYTWHFFTTGTAINPLGRRCHRGPMIDVEIVMAKPFTYVTEFNKLRAYVLGKIVTTRLTTVQTREVVLRAMNNILGPMFARLLPRKKEIQVLICEKRNSVDVENDLGFLNQEFLEALTAFKKYNIPRQHLDLLSAAITSHSPVVRVAGKCAMLLLASYIEMDYYA